MGLFDTIRERRNETPDQRQARRDQYAVSRYKDNPRAQNVLARFLNEEMAAEIGDGTSVNLQDAMPRAYFNAAKRIADLGGDAEAQQLYQAGLAALAANEKTALDLAKLKNGSSDAALARLDRIQAGRAADERPQLTGAEEEQFIRDFGMNSADAQRYRMQQQNPDFRGETLDYNVKDVANRVSATQAIETLPKARESAVAGVAGIEAIRGAVDMLNEGVRTGTTANMRQWFARALATLGGMPVDEQAIVDNTDAYLGAISPLVFARVTALRPVTQEERSYVEQMAGGDISLTEGSLRKLLEIAYKSSVRDVQSYSQNRNFLSGNEIYGQAIAGAFAPVDLPDSVNFAKPESIPTFATEAEAAAAEAAGTLKKGTRIKIGDQVGVWQ